MPVQTSSFPISESLLKTQLFSGLTKPELESLGRRAVRKSYRDGQRLFAEGDACEGLFVVARGAVRIFKASPNGREQVLAMEGPGSSIAELPVFDGGEYPASAVAVGETERFLSPARISRRSELSIRKSRSKCWPLLDRDCGG